MGLTATRPANARLRQIGALVSGALPLLATLGGLDDRAWLTSSSASLGAALELDPALAPSLPAAALIRLFALLPLGSLGLRAALLSALSLAVAAAALFLACETLSRVQGVSAARVGGLLALGAAWGAVALGPAWHAGLDAGPNALSLALASLTLERVTALEAAWPNRDCRPLATAGAWLVLLLASEPLTALVVWLVCLPSVRRVLRARPGASARLAMLGFALGGACLAMSIGLGATPGAWLHSASAAQGAPLWRGLWQGAAPVVVVGLLGGLGLLLAPGVHRLGQVWVGAFALPLLMAALGPSPNARPTPDPGPYLIACGAVVVLATSLLASLLAGRGAGRLTTPFALSVMLLGGASLEHAQRHASSRIAQGRAVDWVATALQTDVPPRALALSASSERAMLLAALWAEGRERPDVLRVSLDSLGELGQVERLARRHPELKPLLRSYLFEGELGEATLQSLVGQRPVRLELHERIAPALYEGLLPDGLWYEVPDAAGNEAELRNAERLQDTARDALAAHLAELPAEPALAALLAQQHYFAALHYAARARHASAEAELTLARRLAPDRPVLAALARALEHSGKAAVDVEPFLARW